MANCCQSYFGDLAKSFRKVRSLKSFISTWFVHLPLDLFVEHGTSFSTVEYAPKTSLRSVINEFSRHALAINFPLTPKQGCTRGETMPQAPNRWGRRKVLTMSQVLSSIQCICYWKTVGSSMGVPVRFLARAPPNIGTPLGPDTDLLMFHYTLAKSIAAGHGSDMTKM